MVWVLGPCRIQVTFDQRYATDVGKFIRIDRMALLIDGYNLLHATDFFGSAGSFASSREALLDFLCSALPKNQLRQTTIVFDSSDAPPGLPRTTVLSGMTIHYASDYSSADAMIEELLEQHQAPRGLEVVSSDHRIQRAARRVGAKFTDSDQWYTEICRTRRLEKRQSNDKPISSAGAPDVAYWVEQFTEDDLPDDLVHDEKQPGLPEKQSKPKRKKEPNEPFEGDISNPFPPGYADDLLEE